MIFEEFSPLEHGKLFLVLCVFGLYRRSPCCFLPCMHFHSKHGRVEAWNTWIAFGYFFLFNYFIVIVFTLREEGSFFWQSVLLIS